MANEQDEKREKVICMIADMMRTNNFSFEYKVVKKPQGIKVTFEVTKEQMDEIVKGLAKNKKQ